MRRFRPASLTVVVVALPSLFGPACSCSSGNTVGTIDAAFPGLDAGRDGAFPSYDGSTCDPVSGAGCPCGTVDEVRSCVTTGVGACGMGTQTCTVEFEFPV